MCPSQCIGESRYLLRGETLWELHAEYHDKVPGVAAPF